MEIAFFMVTYVGMKHRLLITLLLALVIGVSSAQVTIYPAFPKDTDSITVTFDATQGNKVLKDLGPPIVYMHAGVITDKSSSSTGWKYVQGNWGKADNKVVMSYVGNNIYQKKYHLRNFYGVPSNEKILQLAFVFRNVDGSKVGRATDGSDMYVDVSQEGFALKRLKPIKDDQSVAKNAFIDIEAITSEVAEITLYLNGDSISSVSNDSVFSYLLEATKFGGNLVEIVAFNGSEYLRDSFHFVVTPVRSEVDPDTSLPNGVAELSPSVMRFTFYAPYKNDVYVLGDFNNWKLDTSYLMHKANDGNTYWLDVEGLTQNKEYRYQYAVNGDLIVADPFSTKVLDPWADYWISSTTYPNLIDYPTEYTGGSVSVFTAHESAFDWKIKDFKPPAKTDLVIYELLLRDFVEAHDFPTLLDSLDYLGNLGVNAIELMPVSEFEGNESWGYNVSFHMALDKYYGTKDGLKRLVDECHARGIAVILDVVYNHAFSQSPLCQLWWDAANFRPSANNPYLNVTARHPFNVGYDFNHESFATQQWLDRVNKYWIEEFNVDGFRYDLSKGFTQKNFGSDVSGWGQYDASRIQLLKRMSSVVRQYKSNAILILEHFADNSEEKELASNGFLLWNNLNHTYNEASMGFASDLTWSSYKTRGHDSADWVVYMESHDEERMNFKNLTFGNSNGSYNVQSLSTALDRIELTSCFFFGVPGPKMIWQFGELGYDYSIEYDGRLGNKPIRWDYFTEKDRRDVYQVMSELIHLKKEYNTFRTSDFQQFKLSFGKIIQLNHTDMDALIIGNFDVRFLDIDPNFQHTGKWYEYFTGDSVTITDTHEKLGFDPGEYRLYTTKRILRPTAHWNVGIKESDMSNRLFQVIPNPSDGRISLVNKSPQTLNGVLSIRTLTGRLVSQIDVDQLAANKSLELMADLIPSIYLVTFQDDSGLRFTQRQVVVR